MDYYHYPAVAGTGTVTTAEVEKYTYHVEKMKYYHHKCHKHYHHKKLYKRYYKRYCYHKKMYEYYYSKGVYAPMPYSPTGPMAGGYPVTTAPGYQQPYGMYRDDE